MRHFDLPIFLNKFYKSRNLSILYRKVFCCLKLIYGLNSYSTTQICLLFGINSNIVAKYLNIYDWVNFFYYFKLNFNFLLFNFKLSNIKRIKKTKNYKAWRHIFNLPVHGQRNHTNAKTRKKYKIW